MEKKRVPIFARFFGNNFFSRWLEKKVIQHVVSDLKYYEQHAFNDMENLKKFIRPGDVVLVEGKQRISHIIKLLTNSSWSHIFYYVGDFFVREGMPLKSYYEEKYGEWSKFMIVEANTGEGVTANVMNKYETFNIRVCRPFKISEDDQAKVTKEIVSKIGYRYDEKNIIELALMLIPFQINPFRKKKLSHYLGSGDEYEVICSGMIAKAFMMVGYPIIPFLDTRFAEHPDYAKSPFGAPLIARHHTQIVPRDYDLSPNFEIIKFNIISTGKFDYQHITWETEDEAGLEFGADEKRKEPKIIYQVERRQSSR